MSHKYYDSHQLKSPLRRRGARLGRNPQPNQHQRDAFFADPAIVEDDYRRLRRPRD